MPRLELDIRITFGGFDLHIGRDVELEGITALFGPSGGGKSTLLRIIAGFEKRSEGFIRFNDHIWQGRNGSSFTPPHLRGVGLVFQDARLFTHLSVLNNLKYADKRSRNQESQINLENVIAALDLHSLLDRSPASLSGGETQRVAIARALLARPQLLLMDEPLAALDFKRKARIIPLIEKLPTTFGIPVIYVTHAIEEAAHLADRMIVLSGGRVVADGAVGDVMERNEIQSILGRFEAAALISAKIINHSKAYHLTEVEFGGTVINMPHIDLAIGTRVRLRVRARDVSLAIERPSGISIQNLIAGTIFDIVEEDHTAFAEVLVDVGGTRLRARISRKSVVELKLKTDMKVYAMIKTISFDRRALG